MPDLKRKKIVRLAIKRATAKPEEKPKKKKRRLKGGAASILQQAAKVTPVFKADGFDELEAWADKRIARLRSLDKLQTEQKFLDKLDMDGKLKLLGVNVHRHIYVTVDLPKKLCMKDKDGPISTTKAMIEMVQDEEEDLYYWLESRWTKGGRIDEHSLHNSATEAIKAAYELKHGDEE
jgi:hypothetical protein